MQQQCALSPHPSLSLSSPHTNARTDTRTQYTLLLQVAFKSDYLRIFQAQQLSAAELLVAREALAEAKMVRVVEAGAAGGLAKWLAAAHAEEQAPRVCGARALPPLISPHHPNAPTLRHIHTLYPALILTLIRVKAQPSPLLTLPGLAKLGEGAGVAGGRACRGEGPASGAEGRG